MRSFSLISILLALAVAAIVWQKLIVKNPPERVPEPVVYTTTLEDEEEAEYLPGECVEGYEGTSDCGRDVINSEQGEMGEQRSRGHDIMMKSFDEKYDKYKGQVNGQ